jgi:branched-chain amino acid transport system permease protein
MEVFLVSRERGLRHVAVHAGEGLALILSMMGAQLRHASATCWAPISLTISQQIGFWPALVLAPLLCGAISAAIEMYGLRVHRNGHIAELLFTFGLASSSKGGADDVGLIPVPYRIPQASISRCSVYGTCPAYRAFMLLISALMFGAIWLGLTRTRIGLVIRPRCTIPEMVGALATACRGSSPPSSPPAPAGRPGRRIGGNYQITEPAMAFTMGPIVFCRGVRRAGIAHRLLHRLAADGPDPDLCRGARLFRGRSPEMVRPHRHQRHALP